MSEAGGRLAALALLALAGCGGAAPPPRPLLLFEPGAVEAVRASLAPGAEPAWRSSDEARVAVLPLVELGRASELALVDARGPLEQVASRAALAGGRRFLLRPAVEVRPAALAPASAARAFADLELGAALALDAGGRVAFELPADLPGRRAYALARRADPAAGAVALRFRAAAEAGELRLVSAAWSLLPLALPSIATGRALELVLDSAAGGVELAGVLLEHPGGAVLMRALGADAGLAPPTVARRPRPGLGPQPAAAVELWRVEVGDERRDAHLLPAGAGLEFELEARAGDVLTAGLAAAHAPAPPGGLLERLPRGLRPPAPAARVRVLWRAGDAPARVLFEDALAAGRWTRLRVPLDAIGAGRLRIESAGPAALAVERPRLAADVTEGGPRERPNVLLLLVDTLRADALGCLGSPRPTSPRLDALAAEGVLCEALRASASWTRPTVATLLTGAHPQWHGLGDGLALPEELETLAERFRAAGYRTAAATANVNVGAPELRFEQGFERFVTHAAFRDLLAATPASPARESSAERLNAIALEWVEAFGDEPFFALLHSMDPHAPYLPPAGAARPFSAGYAGPLRGERLGPTTLRRLAPGMDAADRAYVRALYDEEVLHQDAAIGELLDELARRGVLQDTLVVVTSDHGEEFFEHGDWDHGYRMWEELLHVPLIVWAPPRWRETLGLGARRVAAPVPQVGIAASLLELCGLAPSAPLQGTSFLPLLRGEPSTPERYYGTDGQAFEGTRIGALADGPLKLIWNEDPATGFARRRLFDLADDPGEQRELSAQRPREVERLLALRAAFEREIAAWSAPAGLRPAAARGERVDLGAAAQRQLEQLGYLDAPGDER